MWNTLTLTYSLGLCTSQYFAITSRSGPSARRGTGRMCMPSADSRANSTAQPGSSTITGSPARSRVRLTMSSAWVAPTVVMMCSGAVCTLNVASFLASNRRRPLSPSGSPYCSENSCSARVPVTLRTAAGRKVDSSQSGGNTPVPGWGLLLILWNMPRISAVALTGGALRLAQLKPRFCHLQSRFFPIRRDVDQHVSVLDRFFCLLLVCIPIEKLNQHFVIAKI